MRSAGQLPPATDEHFVLRAGDDGETGAAQQGLRAGPVRRPPVGRIAGVAALDEMQSREARPVEYFDLREFVVFFEGFDLDAAPLHGLEHQKITGDVLVNQIQGQQGMAKVIEDAEEQHDIEPLAQRRDVKNRQLAELELNPAHLGGKAGLVQIVRVRIHGDYALGAAPLHLDRVEAGIAADVEDGPATQISGHRIGEAAPLHRRVVA
jgi:hypothetical protein